MALTFVHLFKVTEVVPQKKLAYTWRYKDFEGSSLVSFELFEEGDKTRLRLTHTGDAAEKFWVRHFAACTQ